MFLSLLRSSLRSNNSKMPRELLVKKIDGKPGQVYYP